MNDDDDLVDAAGACRVIGGCDSPINPATLYRGIKSGRFPKPIKVSANISRWRIRALKAALAEREAGTTAA